MMNKQAQVGIIVAILVVTLLASVLITIQVYYIPKWMKEREAEHMDVVANQFANLKYSLDLLAAERTSSPLTNTITLGSKEFHILFLPAPSAPCRFYPLQRVILASHLEVMHFRQYIMDIIAVA